MDGRESRRQRRPESPKMGVWSSIILADHDKHTHSRHPFLYYSNTHTHKGSGEVFGGESRSGRPAYHKSIIDRHGQPSSHPI